MRLFSQSAEYMTTKTTKYAKIYRSKMGKSHLKRHFFVLLWLTIIILH